MATKMTLLARFRYVFKNLDAVIKRIYDPPSGMFGVPALCYDTIPSNASSHQRTGTFPGLAALLEPIVYVAPRNRRTAERRKTRKMTEYHFKPAVPKTNIVHCLACGSPHERETICGKCYEKVREETETLKKAMDQDTFYYNYPQREVKYVYEDDTSILEKMEAMNKDKRPYIVNVPKTRPEWYARDLDKRKSED